MEKVFEIHAHTRFEILPILQIKEILQREMKWTGTDKICLLSLIHEGNHHKMTTDRTQNVKNLFLKHEFGEKAYAFASLEHPLVSVDKKTWQASLLEQAKEYHKAGFDGMKMLEGYPSLRKVMGISLCDEIYDGYYAYMEENQIPIIMHLANPCENWDINKADKYAIQLGRVYDESYPTKQQLQDEMFEILNKFPNLCLTLAHMGFMSNSIEDAERFMSYKNTRLDITPGGEQLIYMSENWDVWKAFFEKYQDRILYGTDFYPFCADTEEKRKASIGTRTKFVRQLFETNDSFMYLGTPFKGVLLDKTIREKIYYKNAERYLKERKKVDLEYIKRTARSLINETENVDVYCKEDMEYILDKIK
ncbi:MAG: amidohydrolase family protein [Clostridia bacterium]|nr:amidohydrolase family protein [Clostridia bacterium]